MFLSLLLPLLLLLMLPVLWRHHLHIPRCLLGPMLLGATLLLVCRLTLHWPGLLCPCLLSWRRCLLSWRQRIIHRKVKDVLLLPQLGRRLPRQLGLGRDTVHSSGGGSSGDSGANSSRGRCRTMQDALASWRRLLLLLPLLLWLCRL
jgi:hypothetical protein